MCLDYKSVWITKHTITKNVNMKFVRHFYRAKLRCQITENKYSIHISKLDPVSLSDCYDSGTSMVPMQC